jgi:hypothetical protein
MDIALSDGIAIVAVIVAAISIIINIILLYLQKQTTNIVKDEKKEKDEKKSYIEKKKDKDLAGYLSKIKKDFEYLDFKGVKALLAVPPKLKKIYVKLRIKRSYNLSTYASFEDYIKLEKEEKEEINNEKYESKTFKEIFYKYLIENSENKMLIAGAPGSGKTTLMKWTALQCVEKNDFFEGLIPVFISLNTLAKEYFADGYKFEGLKDYCKANIKSKGFDTDFFDVKFDAGKLIFLLDGLDEIENEDKRKKVIKKVIEEQFIGENKLIVTSRFSGLQPAKGIEFKTGFLSFIIEEFTQTEVEEFLKNWYQNIEACIDPERSEEQSYDIAKENADDLISVLKDNNYKALRDIAVNPLMLTIIALVHRTRFELPRERHKLYEELITIMIELWNLKSRNIKISFKIDVCVKHLSEIAFFMMDKGERVITSKEIKALLPEEIDGKPIDDFLYELVLKSGIFYGSEGKYGFSHLTFQEYLTAKYFTLKGDIQKLLSYAKNSFWNETFLLFINMVQKQHEFFEIIRIGLIDKNYWKSLNLWEASLNELIDEEIKKDEEIKFAKTILNICIKSEQKLTEEMQCYFVDHYPVYEHAKNFAKEGWILFEQTDYPFLRSLGNSILAKSDSENREKWFKKLSERINKSSELDQLTFLQEHSNSFILLLMSKNIKLISFILNILKEEKSDNFIKFNILIYYSEIYYNEFINFGYLEDLINFKDLIENFKSIKFNYLNCLRDLIDYRYYKDYRDLKNFKDLKDLKILFNTQYKKILIENKDKIHKKSTSTLINFQKLSNKELLEYFPNTSYKELIEFKNKGGKVMIDITIKECLDKNFWYGKECIEFSDLIEKLTKKILKEQDDKGVYLVVIEGLASVGKSWMSDALLENIAKKGNTIAFINRNWFIKLKPDDKRYYDKDTIKSELKKIYDFRSSFTKKELLLEFKELYNTNKDEIIKIKLNKNTIVLMDGTRELREELHNFDHLILLIDDPKEMLDRDIYRRPKYYHEKKGSELSEEEYKKSEEYQNGIEKNKKHILKRLNKEKDDKTGNYKTTTVVWMNGKEFIFKKPIIFGKKS